MLKYRIFCSLSIETVSLYIKLSTNRISERESKFRIWTYLESARLCYCVLLGLLLCIYGLYKLHVLSIMVLKPKCVDGNSRRYTEECCSATHIQILNACIDGRTWLACEAVRGTLRLQ